MGRKGKQAGGNKPLTHHERKHFAHQSSYGTITARLGQDSQYKFGYCGLSLHPAIDHPVATPSGFVYERSTMLEYLLTKTQALKQEQVLYDQWMAQQQFNKQQEEYTKKRKADMEKFEAAQKVVTVVESVKKQKCEENPLHRTSYWLAQSQPTRADRLHDHDDDNENNLEGRLPPPKRPLSPNSQQPLRRKDLISLDLKWSDDQQHVVCAISEKTIHTQPAIALIPKKSSAKAQVVLESVYHDIIGNDDNNKNDNKEPLCLVCPVSGQKLTKILKLQRGGSSFASSDGVIEAKRYRPTMT
jgi:nitric oxide synthase-interacting protein